VEPWKCLLTTMASWLLLYLSWSCHVILWQLELIISSEENQIIQQTGDNSKAASLVLDNLNSSLKAGNTEMFDKFLSILDAHDNGSCVELANQMRAEWDTAGKCYAHGIEYLSEYIL